MQIPLEPHEISVDDDLHEAAKQVEVKVMLLFSMQLRVCTHTPLSYQLFSGIEIQEKMKMNNEGLLDVGMLQQYAIVDGDVDLAGALQSGGGKVPSGGVVSVKSNKTKAEKQGKRKEKDQSSKKRSKDGFKSNKKKKV